MLGKNRGKSRRYKHEAVGPVERGVDAPSQLCEQPGALSKLPWARPLPGVGSQLSLTHFADTIEPQMLRDLLDCTLASLLCLCSMLTAQIVASTAKKLMFPLEMCILFDKQDKSWFQPLFFDALYLNVMVFTTQVYFNFLLNRCNHNHVRKPDVHFVKSVRLLRERLLAEDETAISDTTVVVVVCMAAHATMMGDYTSARNHLQGLHKIIGLRGGIASVARPKLLIEAFR